MARGKSGRIVLQVDTAIKNELYAALAKEGLTLKAWFIRRVADYLEDIRQPALFGGPHMERKASQEAQAEGVASVPKP